MVVAAAPHFGTSAAVETFRNHAIGQLRLNGSDGLSDGSPDGLCLTGRLMAQPLPTDCYQGLCVCFESVINGSILGHDGSINSGPVTALGADKMLNSDFMSYQMHHDPIRHIGNSHRQLNQTDGAMFCQHDFPFPFLTRILARLNSNRIHGGVFHLLPGINVVYHFDFYDDHLLLSTSSNSIPTRITQINSIPTRL